MENYPILAMLFEKLKESMNNQKVVENEINNLVKQNNNLLQQLQICNNKLVSQNDFCKKMKGLVIFLVTLVMRKKQNYKVCRVDLTGARVENNNKKSLVDFVYRYLDYHKNKNKSTNNNSNINPSIEKRENFTINQNSLFQNLNNKNFEEFYKDNESVGSFNRNINLDLDLRNAKSNSSLNVFNNNIKQNHKK